MNIKKLFNITESYEQLERRVSRDCLYAIADLKLVPVVRCGQGPIHFPRSSLELISSGQVDLSVIVSRRHRGRLLRRSHRSTSQR